MKNLGTWITIAIFFVGVVAGWGKLQAETSDTKTKVIKVEDKVEVLSSRTDKLEVKQDSIKDDIQNVDKKVDKVIDILLKTKGAI